MLKKIILSAAIFLFAATGLFSQISVNSVIDSDSFKEGDLVELSVTVENNSGLHGIYFDIDYDSDFFEFIEVENPVFSDGNPHDGELLYADNSSLPGLIGDASVAVSYTMKGADVEIYNTGLLAKVIFRVIKQEDYLSIDPDKEFSFGFSEYGIIDGRGDLLLDTLWNSSRYFKIEQRFSNANIIIHSPFYYKSYSKSDSDLVINEDKSTSVKVETRFTTGDFKTRIYNEKYKNLTTLTDATVGYHLDTEVKVDTGFNKIIAELYDSNSVFITSTFTVMHLAPDNEFIKIVSPKNHGFLNSDMTTVEVESPFTGVKINNINAKLISSKDGINTYSADLWLRKGFNKINATATHEDVTYTDYIEIYYRKNSEHFKLVTPDSDQTYKNGMLLNIQGEIGSEYRDSDDSTQLVKNDVTLEIKFTPDDTNLYSRYLDIDPELVITPVENSSTTGANYQFKTKQPINIDNLDNGTLYVNVYKNRDAEGWDDKVTKVCFINSNPLKIELTQPNVYSRDILDSFKKIDGFDDINLESEYGVNNLSNTVSINNEGALYISNTELNGKVLDSGNTTKGIIDIEEAYDGTLYALKNTNGGLEILHKQPQDSDWSVVSSNSGLIGYDIEYCDRGLLVGASNLYSSSEDGLYLLDGTSLKNIDLPLPVPHIQFVKFRNDKVYLYGNYFSNLYSFDHLSIEANSTTLRITSANFNSTPLSNNESLEQIVISKSADTVILRDELGNIEFYNKSSYGYNIVPLESLNGIEKVSGKYIVSGEYSKGDYVTYLIMKDNSYEVIMKNKKSGNFFRNNFDISKISDNISDVKISFKDDYFHFLYSGLTSQIYTKAQVFFNQVLNKTADKVLPELPAYTSINNSNLFISGDTIIANYGDIEQDVYHELPVIIYFYEYSSPGTAKFSYINNDIDGLTGFSFEVDQGWINSNDINSIELGFTTYASIDRSIADSSLALTPINDFLAINEADSSKKFKVSRYYDAKINRYIVNVDFDTLQTKGSYINFDIKLNPVGNESPKIYNLTVGKKIPVLLTINKAKETSIDLPIQGYISDRTVTELYIENNPAKVERNGSFYYNYKVDTVKEFINIKLLCFNSANERAETSFTANIVESKNNLGNVKFFTQYDSLNSITLTENRLSTQDSSIFVSGDFYGLEGSVAGYKTISMDSSNTVLNSGLFSVDTTKNSQDIYTSFGIDNPGSGYSTGSFIKAEIPLEPGEQKVIIYCENPDGTRVEYKINGVTPVAHYNMDSSDQKITFTYGDDVTDSAFNMNIIKHIPLNVYESGEAPNYVYEREFTISGQVDTLYSTNLIVKSFNTDAKFENGQSQITIPLEPGNRFSVPVTLTMDSAISKDFVIGFIPDSPLLTNIKTGVKISATKNYANTNYIPDFSEIKKENVVTLNDLPNIPVKMKFNRDDVPVPGYIKGILLLNYEDSYEGFIIRDEDNPEFYKLVNENKEQVYLDQLKKGNNRLSWNFKFIDQVTGGQETMSSSAYSDRGMADYFFYYPGLSNIESSVVSFSKPFEDRLYSEGLNAETLPEITITRDKTTEIELLINNNVINIDPLWTDSSTGKELKDYVINTSDLKQGRNSLLIRERLSNDGNFITMENISFIFDNKAPEVSVESYKYSSSYDALNDVSFTIKEANYDKVALYVNGSISNILPTLEILGSDTYRVSWTGLNTVNTELKPVYLEVFDLAGKKSISANIPVFEPKERPKTDNIREVKIDLPKFTGPAGIPNEENQLFAEHTKYAPDTYLEKNDITAEVLNNNYNLIVNENYINFFETPGIDIDSKQVDVHNDMIVVGNPSFNGNKGSVKVFKMTEGIISEVDEILPEASFNEGNFGRSVATNGNKIVVQSDNKISVYTLETDSWTLESSFDFNSSSERLNISDNSKIISVGARIYINNNSWVLFTPISHDNTKSISIFNYSISGNSVVCKIAEEDIVWKNTATGYQIISEKLDVYLDYYTYSNNSLVLKKSNKIFSGYYDKRASTSTEIANYKKAKESVNSRYINFNGTFVGDEKSLYQINPSTGIAYLYSSGIGSFNSGYYLGMRNKYFIDVLDNKFELYKAEENNWSLLDKLDIYSDKVIPPTVPQNSIVYDISDDFSIIIGDNTLYIYSLGLSKLRSNSEDNKYIVVKVPNIGITFDDFKNSIGFESYIVEQHKTEDLTKETVSSMPVRDTEEKFLEGTSYYYFISEVETIEESFTASLQSIQETTGYIVKNRGSLRLKLDKSKFGDTTPSEIYYTGKSGVDSTELNDLLFNHQLYISETLNSQLTHTGSNYKYTRESNTDNTTVSFWLRPEDEGIGRDSYSTIYSKAYKEVLRTTDISLGYNNSTLEIYRDGTVLPLASYALTVNPLTWNLVTIKVSREGVASLYINGEKAVTDIGLTEVEKGYLLDSGSEYDFSQKSGANSGFYSIAEPQYVDKLLTDEQIARIYRLGNEREITERLFKFSDNSSFGDSTHDLRLTNNLSSDHLNSAENADWRESNSSSLKASSEQSNYLKVIEEESGKNVVIFKNSDSYTRHGLDVIGGADSFTLKSTQHESRYFFGNKTGNSGLGANRWYTISGNVKYLEPGSEAKLVLRINNKEQSINLKEGPFEFRYNNPDMDIPYETNLYIDITGKITLDNDLMFNEGDYILEKDQEASGASTKNIFDKKGTVFFWYKPHGVNNAGSISHSVTLIDTEYFKIGAKSANGEDAKYYLEIEGVNTDLSTEKKVDYNWQFIQLSYDFDKNSVYLYVNGDIVTQYEGELPNFTGSITGIVPQEDNFFIGVNKLNDEYAEGYIDDLYISKYYSESRYSLEEIKHNFFYTNYDDSNGEIKLIGNRPNVDTVLSPSTVNYKIVELGGNSVNEGIGFPVNVSGGGRYTIIANAVINGHNYSQRNTFNINNSPKITLQAINPLAFSGHKTDLEYKFSYDRSHQLSNGERLFAGIAAKVTFNSTETKVYYLVQDFFNNQSSDWRAGELVNSATPIIWTNISPDNGANVKLLIPEIISDSDIKTEFKYFYFKDSFDIETLNYDVLDSAVHSYLIPLAALDPKIENKEGVQYKISLDITGQDKNNSLSHDIIDKVDIVATAQKVGKTEKEINEFKLNKDGTLDIFYDNILPNRIDNTPDYGNYRCNITLKYSGMPIISKDILEDLVWSRVTENSDSDFTTGELAIKEFSLLYMSKDPESPESKGSFILKYYASGVNGLKAVLEFIDSNDKVAYTEEKVLINSENDDSVIFNDVAIPVGNYRVQLTLKSDKYIKKTNIDIVNSAEAPEIHLNNVVESKIGYNNVFFSWKGYFNGNFNSDIEYLYQIDNRGWSEPSKDWRSVRFFNLKEGYHRFEVKARYNNRDSSIAAQTFFVDINRPEFKNDLITVLEERSAYDILKSVKIVGSPGAITDASLRNVLVNGQSVSFDRESGAFATEKLEITEDGKNKFTITAIDSVGNFSDHEIIVENSITSIEFPKLDRNVLYSPLTIVGNINSSITADMEIFLLDPFSSRTDDFSGWKKAKINEDRTFFIEDVLVNSGAENNKVASTLKLAVRFSTGETFYRDINVTASAITMPIEMNLSTNAAEGENEDTYVEIDCKANVDNISSWSIDYNGDGIYDEIDLVENPELEKSKKHFWSHKYSSIDKFFPRVRVITTDGNFFSVADSLIIHEKIKDASPNLVNSPIAISSAKTELDSHKVFVLREEEMEPVVDIYFSPKFESRLLKTGNRILLSSFGIENPNNVRAYNEGNLFISSYVDGWTTITQLVENSLGNYINKKFVKIPGECSDITLNRDTLYVSFKEDTRIISVEIQNDLLITETLVDERIELPNSNPIGKNSHLTATEQGLLLSDYDNQRVIKLDTELRPVEQFGSFGDKGGEFISPSHIANYADRYIVFDEKRNDIQVMDTQFNLQSILEYNYASGYHNYVEEGFFNDIADVDLIAKEEGDRLYYYALVLSKSAGQLSMLRLPQYQEMRARVRNNRIVFIKDGEVFSSKPDGSDLLRVLSSDSLPKIEGTLDYPALSPDGRNLVFTSRVNLYNSGYQQLPETENIKNYDNIYVVNIETQKLTKLNLGEVSSYSVERPVFNSNGDKIIFSAKAAGEKWQIWVYDLKTGVVDKLFTSDENTRFPFYSPDDRFVVFTTDYDGDQDIEIIDTQNTTMRLAVTDNFAGDTLPVWSSIYPGEVSDDYKVDSKISFVSEKNFKKAVYTVYLSRPDASDLRIFNIRTNMDGGNIEDAHVKITSDLTEGDYPCFTGDGKSLFYEYFDGNKMNLKKFSFVNETNAAEIVKSEPSFVYEDVEILQGARRPAGMKNAITNFMAINTNGDEVELTWDRYTDSDILYTVQFLEQVEGGKTVVIDKKVSSQVGTALKGLKLGAEYKFRVLIKENGKEVTTSQWRTVQMPKVVAKASYSISPVNPYVVNLEAWTPENFDSRDGWKFTWIIDNQPITVNESETFAYEFATSGTKIVQLMVDGPDSETTTKTDISKPMEIEIKSDIVPVITKTISDDFNSIILDASGSLGEKINWSSATWTVTGSGNSAAPQQLKGITKEFDISGYSKRIYVTLNLERVLVNGQNSTDIIEKTEVVELNLPGVIPVIDTRPSEIDEKTVIFDGSQTIGNVNWPNAQWTISGNGMVLERVNSVSSFTYTFPESNSDTVYTVALTVPKQSDGESVTTSKIVSIEAAPIKPVIEYSIIENGLEDGKITTAKVVLDCTKSLGNNIDFSQAKWTIPTAASYGDQPTQYGPTAVFCLNNIDKGMVLSVNLALTHRGSSDFITQSQLISINADELPKSEIHVNKDFTDTPNGKVYNLDVYNSTGGNINWENTTWQVTLPDSSVMNLRGPSVSVPVNSYHEDSKLVYTVTLYRNSGISQSKTESIDIEEVVITPIITTDAISGSDKGAFELSVLETVGQNIDWERTEWYIHDGVSNPVVRRGAHITHQFPESSTKMGYPVYVNMYFKGSAFPFVAYKSVDVEESTFTPAISHTVDSNNSNIISFDVSSTVGTNIKWSSTKWNFGDGSQPKYGAVTEHKFPLDSEGKDYTVTAVLTRAMPNGYGEETIKVTKKITIGADDITAKVKATVVDDFLILSAADSEGSGLLLDRSVWLFPGKGDNASVSNHIESGEISRERTSSSESYHGGLSFGYDNRGGSISVAGNSSPIGWFLTTELGFSIDGTTARSTDTITPDEDYINRNDSFSSQNMHTGMVCRRSIGDEEDIVVALTVYRMKSDGSTEAETVTVKVDINSAKVTASSDGVVYGN